MKRFPSINLPPQCELLYSFIDVDRDLSEGKEEEIPNLLLSDKSSCVAKACIFDEFHFLPPTCERIKQILCHYPTLLSF